MNTALEVMLTLSLAAVWFTVGYLVGRRHGRRQILQRALEGLRDLAESRLLRPQAD